MDHLESPDKQKRRDGEGGAKKGVLPGPCFLKMLVTGTIAGSIIGKSGAVISQIEQQTGVLMRLSASASFFPGTQDRVLIISGAKEQIAAAAVVVLEKIRDNAAGISSGADSSGQTPPPAAVSGSQSIVAKLVVPKSACSMLIGKGGEQIRMLQDTHGVKIQISNREEGLTERVVQVSGTFDTVQQAVLSISTLVQADPNLASHQQLDYSHTLISPGMHAPSGHPMGRDHLAFGGRGTLNPSAAGVSSEVLASPCEISMDVADGYVGVIIGRSGTTLTDITAASGARITISQRPPSATPPGTAAATPTRRITITGTVTAVHTAHVLILQKIYDAAAQAQGAQYNNLAAQAPRPGMQQPSGGPGGMQQQQIGLGGSYGPMVPGPHGFPQGGMVQGQQGGAVAQGMHAHHPGQGMYGYGAAGAAGGVAQQQQAYGGPPGAAGYLSYQ